MTYFNTFIHINQMCFNALINIAIFTLIKTAMVLRVNKYCKKILQSQNFKM